MNKGHRRYLMQMRIIRITLFKKPPYPFHRWTYCHLRALAHAIGQQPFLDTQSHGLHGRKMPTLRSRAWDSTSLVSIQYLKNGSMAWKKSAVSAIRRLFPRCNWI
jgi:hypothetical protein